MKDIKGLLMRVGIDQTYGQYNAPINSVTNDYLYMPIPGGSQKFNSGMETFYKEISPFFKLWCDRNNTKIEFPSHFIIEDEKQVRFIDAKTHLDPDFDHSTYGDQSSSSGRGSRVEKLNKGDFIVFFASFKPIVPCEHKLVYALIGILFIEKVLKVSNVPKNDWYKNAHTRIKNSNNEHLVVFADPPLSGRFNKAIPIGEFRNGSYRVKNEILEKWGGIGVTDGFIQRSVNPPWFTNPEQFLNWLDAQHIKLIHNNWE